jgi:hypothetical protein
MNMKKDIGYNYYITYLNYRLISGKIDQNEFSLLKISYYNYSQFMNRFNSDIDFKKDIENKHITKLRDEKINKIIDEDNIN